MNQKTAHRRVEIIIVLLVIAGLAAYSIPRHLRAQRVAREAACHANITAIEEAVDLHKLAYDDAMPLTLDALYGPGKVVKDAPMPACPLKGRYTLNGGRVVCDHPR